MPRSMRLALRTQCSHEANCGSSKRQYFAARHKRQGGKTNITKLSSANPRAHAGTEPSAPRLGRRRPELTKNSDCLRIAAYSE